MIYPYKDKTPVIDPSVFIADYTTISGDVTIGPESINLVQYSNPRRRLSNDYWT